MVTQDQDFARNFECARAFRGRILYTKDSETLIHHEDGGLLIDANGIIQACDDWSSLEPHYDLNQYERIEIPSGTFILPGLIDMHVHLPQMAVSGCQAPDLLSWLSQHIFAEEQKFSDSTYAQAISQWFFTELSRNGTTTAAVFLTAHTEGTQIAFETAMALGNRVIMGQNLMDVNAPSGLLKTAEKQLKETEQLCQRWHGVDEGRLQYAWMPRFAITSSPELLKGLGELRAKYPNVYLHTHLSEQLSEIEVVKQQFPWAKDYTDVYEHFGLLGPKTILAHAIHLSDDELSRIKSHQSGLAHCPSSNFFLKSGRFRLMEMLRKKVLFGLGTDVGAGPELSMLKVMRDAQFRQDDTLISLTSILYAATQGAAKALFLDHRIGSFEAGKEADFILLNPTAKPGFALPQPSSDSKNSNPMGDPNLLLSRTIYLGDDRMIVETYVRGKRIYSAKA